MCKSFCSMYAQEWNVWVIQYPVLTLFEDDKLISKVAVKIYIPISNFRSISKYNYLDKQFSQQHLLEGS